MVDAVVSSEDIAVFAGPDTVNVQVDFGSDGPRGSQIFVNLGQPGSHPSSLAPNSKVMDLYINNLSTDDEYQYVYQLQNVLGTLTWVRLFKLVSNNYSRVETATFADGRWSKNIPVADIIPSDFVGSVTASNFNIQYSVLNQNLNPIASSMMIGEIATENNILVLPVTISAIELVDGTYWSDIDDPKTIHMLITVV